MKTYSTILTLALAFSVIPLSTLAEPDHHHGKTGKFMAFFDSNQDGTVTIEELNEASKKRFQKMDADNNGVVTQDEFRAYVSQRKQERQQQHFSLVDSDSNGQISKEEYLLYQQQRAEKRFQDMDTNNDGVVNNSEFSTHKSARWVGKGKHDKGRHHHKNRFFSKLDSNNDQQITLEESLTAWTNWFKSIDINNDQIVTADEVKAYRSSDKN